MSKKRKKRIKMPSATSIVARSYPDYIIGVDNELPWHLRTDLQIFKKRTASHAIIMGRKTYESLGRPLPNRVNIVLSRSEIEEIEGVKWAPNPETALLLADIHSIYLDQKEFFIIGGEKIYDIFHKYINKFFLTDVYTGRINGDAKFDHQFLPSEWKCRSELEYKKTEHDDFDFRITCFHRLKPNHRKRSKEEFLKTDSGVISLLKDYSSKYDFEDTKEILSDGEDQFEF